MSYAYETALASAPSENGVEPRNRTYVHPGFAVVMKFLWGAGIGAIAAGEGVRGMGALWGGVSNALFWPVGRVLKENLGGVGSALSLTGNIIIPIYASRYGVGKADWPPSLAGLRGASR